MPETPETNAKYLASIPYDERIDLWRVMVFWLTVAEGEDEE